MHFLFVFYEPKLHIMTNEPARSGLAHSKLSVSNILFYSGVWLMSLRGDFLTESQEDPFSKHSISYEES